MPTIQPNQFAINGVIDTDRPVMDNIQTLATAAGCWATYDINQGRWAVVINREGDSIASFNDSNIIGAINITGTGITELYNKVQLQFPHKDINDQVEYIIYEIPEADRFPNEILNTLNIELDCVNDPVQAELIAIRELKQSRVDKIIQFRTDFSKLGLKAGDIIDVTNSAYGFTNKKFRIISLSEEDGDDNTVQLGITALEYDSTVYDSTGLIRYEKLLANGIISKGVNFAATSSDNQASIKVSDSPAAAEQGLSLLFNAATGSWVLNQASKLLTMPSYVGSPYAAVLVWFFQPDVDENNNIISGYDLDIRCRLINPDLGQYTVDDALGYTGASSTFTWPAVNPILYWGGDNTGVGVETVLVDISQFMTSYPSERYLIVECRGNWYGKSGSYPVQLYADVYQGGSFSLPAFTFVNSTYARRRRIDGLSVYINSEDTGAAGATTPGAVMGYFVYDRQDNTFQFQNNLYNY